MELDAFVRERRPRWDRLERLLDQVERNPEGEADPRRVQEIVRLYRQACSDLNQARSLTAQPAFLDRLNLLTGRGYRFVYRDTRRTGLRQAVVDFFVREVPAAFRRQRTRVAAAAGAVLLGALLGAAAVASDPGHARRLVPPAFYTSSPAQRVAELEKKEERIDSVEAAATFSAFLFTHNIQVSFLAFSLGALTIVGGYLILFYNGVILGAVAAQYVRDGVTTFFFAWVGPHGAVELPSIAFAGAAGLVAGHAFLLPGDRSVGASIRAAMPDVRRMLVGTAAFLVVAGLIEGSFSQFTAKTFPYGLKIGVAVVLFALLVLYLFAPRPGRNGGAS